MACLFCEATGKLSKEHLWPAWAREVELGDGGGEPVPHSLEFNDTPTKRWSAPPFTATWKGVCQRCNNGWMSHIESSAKSVAAPLMQGKTTKLTAEDQEALATWAYLKVLIFERVDTRQRLIPRDRYQRFRGEGQGPQIPVTASVYIAENGSGRHGQYAHRGLTSRGRPGRTLDLFVGTFTIGRLVLQVSDTLTGEATLTPPPRHLLVSGRDRRIWPVTGTFEWPPGRALSDYQLKVFAGPEP